jgi:N12 class adenine-specific DNA methylase
MFGISWIFMHKRYVQFIFLFWVSLPYVLAVSIVLIPGLAVRRQVSYFKSYKSGQLKHEEMKLYSSYKQFESKEDEEIIAEKKELEEKLERIQSELETLKKMRNSHIDRKSSH